MSSSSSGSPRIIVTGGAGVVGYELITQLLSLGKNVTAIYHNRPISISSTQLTVIPCDILDVDALENLMNESDEVYHCAGLVSFSGGNEKDLYKINVEGTANVVNAAINAGIRKLVHVSSVAALGRIRQHVLINENMHWTSDTSNSKYGQSKYMAEMEVWRGIAEGLNAVIINPSLIIGGQDWNSSSTEIFKTAYDEFPWYSEGTTGFVGVKDVARAMIMLMDSEISGERFIISAENKTYHELFNLIADAFNKKRPVKKVTPFLAAMVWRLEYLKSIFTSKPSLVTKETAATALAKAAFDNSKLKKFFPSFQYTSLAQSIAETCVVLQQKVNNH